MKILVAEDDPVSQQVLVAVLKKWGYEPQVTDDGEQAWGVLQRDDRPMLAILDWMMPGMSGVDVCRKLRAIESDTHTYVIMLTALTDKEHLVEGLDAGASDYVAKPFDMDELKARLNVGQRVIDLQTALSDRVNELQKALDHVSTLQGILPLCMHCHKIRDDKESWLRIENYLMEHADVQFSHGICSDCMKEHYSELMSDSDEPDNDVPDIKDDK